ncbi:MAG: hypothetical protein EOP48_14190 [Sphingobacteriales bacterium]|nr:MAG: hypothetical protein EOP48_14190 [Sphingobacteriales bacterium]
MALKKGELTAKPADGTSPPTAHSRERYLQRTMRKMILTRFTLALFCTIPLSGYSQHASSNTTDKRNDTLIFQNFKGINFDSGCVNIDIDFPSKLEKYEKQRRFKADTISLRKIENRIFSTFIDNCGTLTMRSKIKQRRSKSIEKAYLEKVRAEAKLNYFNYDRRYFGYYDSSGRKNIVIKFVPKQVIDNSKIAAVPNLSYRTLPTLNYNEETDCLWFIAS